MIHLAVHRADLLHQRGAGIRDFCDRLVRGLADRRQFAAVVQQRALAELGQVFVVVADRHDKVVVPQTNGDHELERREFLDQLLQLLGINALSALHDHGPRHERTVEPQCQVLAAANFFACEILLQLRLLGQRRVGQVLEPF